MTPIPQYAKTTHPDVLAAIRRNTEGVIDFHRRACEFAVAQGVPKGAYHRSAFAGHYAIRSLGGDTMPTTGRWKRGYNGYGWVPFRNNPVAAQMEAVTFTAEPIPGLPSAVTGYSPAGTMIATPAPFIVDETAYLGFSMVPGEQMEKFDLAEGGWVEILASEYHLNRETLEKAGAGA